MKDKLNRCIQEGDTIVYSTSSRDYGNFKFAIVQKVEEKKITINPITTTYKHDNPILGKTTQISFSERILILDEHTDEFVKAHTQNITES